MQRYFAVIAFLLLIGMVVFRVFLLKRKGIAATKFGKLDKTDFIILPFAIFYFYLIFANAFNFPSPAHSELFKSEITGWLGVVLCIVGLALLLWSLISFGKSFRIGIDSDRPDKLVTSGAFSISRNPIYLAFAVILLGQFLIFPNWILLLYLAAGVLLFHRQVLREEDFLKTHYGKEFFAYCRKVRRYL